MKITPVMVPHDADGQPRRRKERILAVEFRAKGEQRTLLSCAKAWWTRKGRPRPVPEGAIIYLGEIQERPARAGEVTVPEGVLVLEAEPAFLCERVPVIVDDEVIDTKLQWTDLRARRRQQAEAAALEEARRQHAATKAARTATATATASNPQPSKEGA